MFTPPLIYSTSTTTICHVLLEQLLSVQQTTEINLCMPARETALLPNYEDNNRNDCSTAVMLVFPKTWKNIGQAEPPLVPPARCGAAGGREGGLRGDGTVPVDVSVQSACVRACLCQCSHCVFLRVAAVVNCSLLAAVGAVSASLCFDADGAAGGAEEGGGSRGAGWPRRGVWGGLPPPDTGGRALQLQGHREGASPRGARLVASHAFEGVPGTLKCCWKLLNQNNSNMYF